MIAIRIFWISIIIFNYLLFHVNEYKVILNSYSFYNIISLTPSITEILFTIKGGKYIIGTTSYCNNPQFSIRLPKIGGLYNPHIEKIIKINPNILITSETFNIIEIKNILYSKNIPIINLNTKKLHNIFFAIRKISNLIKKQNQGKRLLHNINKTLINNKFQKSPKVIIIISIDPIIVSGPNTFSYDILKIMKSNIPLSINSPSWPILSTERFLNIDPNFIIIEQTFFKIFYKKISMISYFKKPIRFVTIKNSIFQRPSSLIIRDIFQLFSILNNPLKK